MIAINTKTQEEYNELMEIYEKKWWVWATWDRPVKNDSIMPIYLKQTCIKYIDRFEYCRKAYFKEIWIKIISFKIFKKNITTNPKYYD